MKKVLVAALILSFFMISVPIFAGEKGASEKALEHASDQSIFNRVTDWFATVGKSDDEKQKILAERRAKRAIKRAEKEVLKAQKEADRKAKEAKEKAEKSKEDMKKTLGIGK